MTNRNKRRPDRPKRPTLNKKEVVVKKFAPETYSTCMQCVQTFHISEFISPAGSICNKCAVCRRDTSEADRAESIKRKEDRKKRAEEEKERLSVVTTTVNGVVQVYDKKDSFKDKYNKYMSSAAWQKKRREYWDANLLKSCYVCSDPWIGFKGKQLHHLTYQRFGNENLNDLVPVCPECHDLISEAWIFFKEIYPIDKRHRIGMTLEQVSSGVAMTWQIENS